MFLTTSLRSRLAVPVLLMLVGFAPGVVGRPRDRQKRESRRPTPVLGVPG